MRNHRHYFKVARYSKKVLAARQIGRRCHFSTVPKDVSGGTKNLAARFAQYLKCPSFKEGSDYLDFKWLAMMQAAEQQADSIASVVKAASNTEEVLTQLNSKADQIASVVKAASNTEDLKQSLSNVNLKIESILDNSIEFSLNVFWFKRARGEDKERGE